MDTFNAIINGSLTAGTYTAPWLSHSIYNSLTIVVFSLGLIILAGLYYHVISLKGAAKGKGILTVFAAMVVSAVATVLIVPINAVYEREHIGRPDNKYCPIYETNPDGTFVMETVHMRGEDGKPAYDAKGEPVFKRLPTKARYDIRLQELTAQVNDTLQLKLYNPSLWGYDSHLCEIDLKTQEGSQWKQQLEGEMDKMMTQKALEAMGQIQSNGQQMGQMADELNNLGREGQQRLQDAQRMIQQLQQQMLERAQNGQGGEGGEGEGQGQGNGRPGDGMRITLPTDQAELERLRRQNIDTDAQTENSGQNPNNEWEHTEGGVDFSANGDGGDK